MCPKITSNTKVEVTYQIGNPKDTGMWFYLAIGSGIYVDVGNTLVLKDHNAALLHFEAQTGDWTQNMRTICTKAVKEGYDSIQFTHCFEGIYKYEIWMVAFIHNST